MKAGRPNRVFSEPSAGRRQYSVHMNRLVEKLEQLAFPERIRPYFTFRWVTVFVAVIAVGSSALDPLNWPASTAKATVQIDRTPKLANSPGFLILHALVLVLGFWLIYATRETKQYYRVRVLFYGMLLGGLVVQMLSFVVPPRP
jgi:hypothetical protein